MSEDKKECCTVKALYPSGESIAMDWLQKYTYPWEALEDLGEFILKLGKTLSREEYEEREEHIWIAKSAQVAPTACIQGPVIIGPGSEVRHGAFLRGKVLLGEKCVVGNSTECKNVLFFNRAKAPHYNYVGDSILGFQSHMGAGSITSNMKSDESNITIHCGDWHHPTGRRKIGALLGDRVEVGCNSVLNPGTVVGCHSTIYPLSMVRGYVPVRSIYKKKNEVVEKHE